MKAGHEESDGRQAAGKKSITCMKSPKNHFHHKGTNGIMTVEKFFIDKESTVLLIVDIQDKLAAVMKERDKVVIENARRLKIPVAVVLAGGYAAEIKDTVDIHLNTVRIAQRVQRVCPEAPVPLAARRPV